MVKRSSVRIFIYFELHVKTFCQLARGNYCPENVIWIAYLHSSLSGWHSYIYPYIKYTMIWDKEYVDSRYLIMYPQSKRFENGLQPFNNDQWRTIRTTLECVFRRYSPHTRDSRCLLLKIDESSMKRFLKNDWIVSPSSSVCILTRTLSKMNFSYADWETKTLRFQTSERHI